jgi:anaerobic selenocysteine-containing dehydrogenase
MLGGYTFSRHSYSLGATGVIMPRVIGTHDDLFKRSTEWDVIAEHTDLLVCFGGVGLKNTGINHGGTTAHPARNALRRFRDRGGHIVSFSPLRDDVDGDCEWQPNVPGDVAIMLALAHVLAAESPADRIPHTYCTATSASNVSVRRRRRRAEVAAMGLGDLWSARRRSDRSPDGWRSRTIVTAISRCNASGTVSRPHGWV